MTLAESLSAARTDTLVRVGIVDDHESVRLGLAAACEKAGFDVIATASTASELVAALKGLRCDVIVLDLSLGDGSRVTDNVRITQDTGASVLVHSIADRVALVREALAAGAAGVIPKSSPTTTVMAAVATVARGDVLNNLEWATAIDADRAFSKAQLGRRERDVLHLYASGLPLKMVAMQLGIAHSTAREYLDRIRVKYVEVGRPAPTKVDLLRRAVEDGILPGLDSGSGNGNF
ncbi:DNA-binding NarL/FixJ family response regulator [Leifsonia psychrotolerans]|uniref:DNA-binding NarL/FixJ family response regulator n=1 Tax=Glaciibacter psychrotolerans TaxID=670054 RepID=A0A7Z0EG21_9MICO|nr:DNA-binding NarL/FixJ family response regulator [Leifsonia psychrotolerans]